MTKRKFRTNVLSMLGMRPRSDWMLHAMVGFGAGVVVGAATALMVTPKSGREMRDELADGANKIVRRGRAQFEQIRNRVSGNGATTAEDRAGV